MARIDVSEVLTDPDFVDPFVVIRAQQSVNDNGRLTQTAIYLHTSGSVQPASNSTYMMFPECARATGDIEIFTGFALTVVTEALSADELCWNGRTYTVVGVSDFSNFGGGHVVALCSFKAMTVRDALPDAVYAYMMGRAP